MRKADNLTTILCRCREIENLNFLEPSGPLQTCNGSVLPFTRWRLMVSTSPWPFCFDTANKGVGCKVDTGFGFSALSRGKKCLPYAENRNMIPQICRLQFRVPYRIFLSKCEKVEKNRQNLRIIFRFQKSVFQFQHTNLASSMYCTMCCVRVCL